MKVLLISGSPRKGNTEFILNKIFEGINSDNKELILLREKEIKHCIGCLYCHDRHKCCIDDDMAEINAKLETADIIILGTPNYFDSVSGLMRDFMDRTHPFYKSGLITGKKVINIIVGGGKLENSKRVFEGCLKYFEDVQELQVVDSYFFKALQIAEIRKNEDALEYIDVIIDKINLLHV